jgi:hypothetical protein
LILLCRPQSASQLVGARSALAVAIYATQAVNNFANRHTFNKFANALQVAVATAGENHISHHAVNHVKVYKLRASPARPILIMHNQIKIIILRTQTHQALVLKLSGILYPLKH